MFEQMFKIHIKSDSSDLPLGSGWLVIAVTMLDFQSFDDTMRDTMTFLRVEGLLQTYNFLFCLTGCHGSIWSGPGPRDSPEKQD